MHPDHVKAFHKDPEGYWDCLTAHDPDVLGTPRHVPHQAEIRAHASDFTPKLMNYASQLVKLQQGRGTSGASEDIVAELGDVVGQLKTRRSARFTRMLKELQSHNNIGHSEREAEGGRRSRRGASTSSVTSSAGIEAAILAKLPIVCSKLLAAFEQRYL